MPTYPARKCICRGRGYYDRWSISDESSGDSGWHEDNHGPIASHNDAGEAIDVAPADHPYWVPGAEILLALDCRARFVERGPCRGCEDRRQAFADRREAKQDRRDARVASLRASSDTGIKRSREMLPWGGEPIKVGHHSEKRHRRDMDRSHNLMRRSIDEGREADRLSSINQSTSISSDDPDALAKLTARLADLTARREAIKASNRAARKAKREPQPTFVLTNLGGNIRRIKKRIESLERAAGAPIHKDIEIRESRIHWCYETNRVQVFSPDPGPGGRKARSKIMREAGFVWSRRNECWQRQATIAAWRQAVDMCQGTL